MKLHTRILFALANCSLSIAAGLWSLDSSCEKWSDQIKVGVHEALDLATNAWQVMEDHANEDQVKAMSKLLLTNRAGDNYESNFNAAKATFANLKAITREPGNFAARSDMRNTIFYCDDARFDKAYLGGPDWRETIRDFLVLEKNTATLKNCYDIGQKKTDLTKMTTKVPKHFDEAGWRAALQKDRTTKRAGFEAATDYSCSIDVCPWFIEKFAAQGFPKIDKDRIEWALELQNTGAELPPNTGALKNYPKRYFDFMKTFTSTVLHELTHTTQGGELVDYSQPLCYDWDCCVSIKQPTNSDTISILAMVLKMWTLGYYVDRDGDIYKLAES
ncbi:hypothetical protein BU16DRAFT_563267 [Lophium mytilinum]|uniref:Lysine-specific metallo-endopeptidase domain-containing protein n=1 Tax=Lophium mytilinum TaxID=390894 RepID=A0A6A6QRH7_9PEZI|nr:hypothetical protein BU16DRAFT_563267 [Lophium mytilinum]